MSEHEGWGFFFWRLFVQFVVSTYFREVTVDGVENIPLDGPIIFVGNHQNQFIDPMLLVAYSPRPLGFLVAQKSMHGIVGFLARIFRAIPVSRPQDSAKQGPGVINIEEGSKVVCGVGTSFLTTFKGDNQIAVKGEDPQRVVSVTSDTELIIAHPFKKPISGSTYKALDKVDQSHVYESVWNRLGHDQCIGIFPEGGSHDRSQLLPLKAGVSLMALGAMSKYGKPVYIVPCGLNYFSGHRFRGNSLLEFGKAFKIPMTFAEQYKQNQRDACNALLGIIKQHMDVVITQAPDHETLATLNLTRRLYQPTDLKLEADKWIVLHHRFLEGFNKFKDHPVLQQYLAELREYQSDLEVFGLQDRHIDGVEAIAVSTTKQWLVLVMIWRFITSVIALSLALPGTLMFSPVGLCARYLSKRWASDALKASEVKIEAKDVLASNKVMIALVGLPLFSLLYIVLVWWYYGFRIACFFTLFLPVFCSFTIRFAEEGFALVKSLKAMFIMRFRCGDKIEELRNQRAALQLKIRESVKTFGPALAGDSNLEDWRIIKEEQIKKTEEKTQSEKKATSMKNILSAKANQKPFKATLPIDKPLISDSEWEELKDIFS